MRIKKRNSEAVNFQPVRRFVETLVYERVNWL